MNVAWFLLPLAIWLSLLSEEGRLLAKSSKCCYALYFVSKTNTTTTKPAKQLVYIKGNSRRIAQAI